MLCTKHLGSARQTLSLKLPLTVIYRSGSPGSDELSDDHGAWKRASQGEPHTWVATDVALSPVGRLFELDMSGLLCLETPGLRLRCACATSTWNREKSDSGEEFPAALGSAGIQHCSAVTFFKFLPFS